MKLTRSFRALVVLAVVGGVASAGLGATSATLNNLDSGSGSISAGVATYYGFSYGGVTLDSTVVATASLDGSGNSVITFTRTSGTWTETDGNSVVTFHVDFSTPILTTGLNFLGTASGTAVSSVGETVRDPVSNVAYLPGLQVYANGINSTQQLTDSKTFVAPISSLLITKSIDIAANGGTGTITWANNTFTPGQGSGVPEPASLGILGVAAAGLLMRRHRKL